MTVASLQLPLILSVLRGTVFQQGSWKQAGLGKTDWILVNPDTAGENVETHLQKQGLDEKAIGTGNENW